MVHISVFLEKNLFSAKQEKMVGVSIYHQKMSVVLRVLNEDFKECLKKKKTKT